MVIKRLLKFLANKKTTKKNSKSSVKKKSKISKRKVAKAKIKKSNKVVVKKERIIGEVVHYFSNIKVAILKLKGPLSTGEKVHLKGHTTDFKQSVTSMQIDHVSVKNAKRGQEIGLKVKGKIRRGDKVFKL